MKSTNCFWNVLLVAFCAIMWISCSKEEGTSTSQVTLEITDAPIDDAEVKGVFVTVADVKVDGNSTGQLTSKTTFDLLALQNGTTKSLGSTMLDARTYSNLSLVLDTQSDANGVSPGCYVLLQNGTKKALTLANTEVKMNSGFAVAANQATTFVCDFDLRKAIRFQNNNPNDGYAFATSSELNSSLRLVVKSRTGAIQGQMSDNISASEKLVVYAYKKGTFVRDTETNTQGESQIRFKKAVTSAVVDVNGNFKLSFLEEGDYEVHVASYEDTNNDGRLELQGTANVDLLLGGFINNFTVNAGATLELSLVVTSVIPL